MKGFMKKHLRNERGISLVVMVFTIIILVIVAAVSVSLLRGPQEAKQELINHENVINEFYDEQNEIRNEILNEMDNDYGDIEFSSDADSDANLPTSTSTEDWDGYVNKPHLLSNMTAIYFDDEGNEVELTASSSQAEWNKWYDYSAQKWANAKTNDGSYWVWIPRFAYKITNTINNGASRNISIVFIDNESRNNAVEYSMKYPELTDDGQMTDYVVHPAFGTNLENGGTNTHRSGFWVAKYEMSMERSDNGGETWYYADGVDALTKNAGNTNSVRAVSKPGVSSWSNITIGNAYSNSFYYNRDEGNSHLMKNSEWGALVYLTHSVYGRDGVEVSINTSKDYITGTGGVLASSTGNEYGVYDLSGGAYEYISAYILNAEGAEYRNEFGTSFAKENKSTEYLTIYPYNQTSDTYRDNWNAYKEYATTRFGDAILETSTDGAEYNSWNEQVSIYPCLIGPFLARGGLYTSTGAYAPGIYGFARAMGSEDNCTFRIIMF